MGNACWELFCLEHNINPTQPRSERDSTPYSNTLFYENSSGTHAPRAIYIDFDPTVIDEVRNGEFRNFFHPDCLISGK